jgi:hypothetical protein
MSDLRRVSGAPAAAWVVWLAVQLAALGICAARTTLWARSPRASEQLALAVILAVQIAASSLLFPYLLRTWRFTLLAIVTALPLAQLASVLADASTSALLRGELYVIVWMIALRFWSCAILTDWSKLLATGFAALLALGAPLLWYLQLDFGRESPPDQNISTQQVIFGPVGGAISQIRDLPPMSAWIIVGIVFLAGGYVFIGLRVNRNFSQQVIH